MNHNEYLAQYYQAHREALMAYNLDNYYLHRAERLQYNKIRYDATHTPHVNICTHEHIRELRQHHHAIQQQLFDDTKDFRKLLKLYSKQFPRHPPLTEKELAIRRQEYQKGMAAEANRE